MQGELGVVGSDGVFFDSDEENDASIERWALRLS
jgi:hypothetical protein